MMIDPLVWQNWCLRALCLRNRDNPRPHAVPHQADAGIDAFDDQTIYLIYAPQTDDAGKWTKSVAEKLKDDTNKLISTDPQYRSKQDGILTNIRARQVILLVPARMGSPTDLTSCAEATTKKLRDNCGDRSWLEANVTVLVQDKAEFFTPDEINQIDGIADDPPTQGLEPRPATTESIDRFQYRAEWVPFLGRTTELTGLATWRGGDEKFAWRLIHGDGGMGKSRLALQACRAAAAEGWHAGFLSCDHLLKLLEVRDGRPWQPRRACFLVIDYPAERPDDVRRLLCDLAERVPTLAHMVRVLLLERDAGGEWFKKLGVERSDFARAKAVGVIDPAPLAPPSEADIDAIYAAVRKNYGQRPASPSEMGQYRHLLAEIAAGLDPTAPDLGALTALLLADALARDHAFGFDGAQPTPAGLFSKILAHEETLWRPAFPNETAYAEARAVLALATLTLGLSRAAHKTSILAGLGLTALPGTVRYRGLVGSRCPDDQLAPLQPDPLGEAFVVRWLKDKREREDDTQCDAVAELAWDLNPLGVVLFLIRVARDLPTADHETLETWLRPAGQSDALRRYLWAGSVVGRVAVIGRSGRPLDQFYRDLYADLARLAAAHLGEAELRLIQAKAAFNLIDALCAEDLPGARDLYDGLARLAQAHPGEAELRLEQAKATVNLINALGAVDLPGARELYDALAHLAQAHPDAADLRLTQAQAAFNLITDLRAVDLPGARELYDGLARLAQAHPDAADLRLRQAKAAFNLIHALRAEDLPGAEDLLADIGDLVAAAPADPALVARWVRGALAIAQAMPPTDLGKAKALLTVALARAAEHPTAPELQFFRDLFSAI